MPSPPAGDQAAELRMGPAGDRRWWERQGREGEQEVKIQGIEEVG